MAGVYVHIPFCRSKCAYCSFFSVASLKEQEQILHATARELVLRRDFLENAPVETIYFGGGTPSLVDKNLIFHILETIFENYVVVERPEITIEANPDDLSPEYLADMAKRFNRLSVGIQSFHDEELRFLGRKHDAEKAKTALSDARNAGFKNIGIDLIYGISDNLEKWEETLLTATLFAPEHISAYALTVEERTSLSRKLKEGKAAVASEDFTERQYELLIKTLKDAGYEHYEISNFAKPGFHSRHNSAYWSGAPYLGAGPSAHSFNGVERRWNVADIRRYQQGIEEGKPFFETERLTVEDRYNEFVMLWLRTAKGVDGTLLQTTFGTKFYDYFRRQAAPFLANHQMTETEKRYHLDESAFLLSDAIIAALFV